ncbi:TonB-dependent receptor plug domain-containing protein [Vibrio harveyi]|uniref:TonB-dependent receptor plug domain-containing protein n=1 Tax=Vibrio harveyi TaxID=669 RepID=UPI003BB6EA56
MKPAATLLFGLFSAATVYANSNTPEQEVIVKDKAETPLTSKQTLTAEDIDKRPTGDGNITDLLKTNPAVQFSNSGNNSLNQGEITPSKISIHGSTSYQNAFTLDGMSMNNDLDPADGSRGVTATKLGSDEQGFYVDSKLIESVTVLDSNISAEYGGFVGGVVDTRTKSWDGETSANVYYRQTDSNWGKQVYDNKLKFDSSENNVASPARFQPSYKKNSYGASFSTGITDNLGLVASVSRRESTIPMVSVGGTAAGLENGNYVKFQTPDQTKNQSRVSDNIFTKLTWYQSARTTFNASLAYSGYTAEMFQNGMANSDYKTNHDGLSATLQMEHMFDFGSLDLSAGYQHLSDDRKSEQNYLVNLWEMDSNFKPVGYASGGPGSLKSEQDNLSLKTKLAVNPKQFGATTHSFVVGGELNKTDAEYIRNQDYFMNTRQDMGFMQMDMATVFKAGTYDAGYTDAALYLEDTINIGNVTVRPGVRVERDTFVEETNFSPRVSADWDIFGTNDSVITVGANRYYGRSILAYALYEGHNGGMYNCQSNCKPNEYDGNTWQKMSDYKGLDDLVSPYSDEFTIRFSQVWRNSLWTLGYVHRTNKDEVLTRYENKGDPTCYTNCYNRVFSNDGETTSDNISLTVSNRQPIEFSGTEHSVSGSLVWQDIDSNFDQKSGYDHAENPAASNNFVYDKVWYDGKVINASDLPATDFNSPFRANVELISVLPQYDLSIYNLWQWQASHDQATRHDNSYYVDPASKEKMYKYERVDFASTFRWDVKAEWKPTFAHGVAIAMEVTNLLNNENATDSFVHKDEVYRVYEAGRQFWLQASYDY